MITDPSILQAALVGYQHEIDKLEAKMAEILQQLGIRKDGGHLSAATADIPKPVGRKRRKMSPAARKRIAEAQRARWAAFHKQHGQKAPAVISIARKQKKRRLSAEARAKLAANLKKARAAKAAKARAAA